MNSQLTHLRSLLAERYPTAVQLNLSRDVAVDGTKAQLLPGKLVEVTCSEQSSGASLLIQRFAKATEGSLACIDAGDSLDLVSLPGEVCQRLLWVRSRGLKESLKAADLLLRDGNLQTVLIDLRLLPQRELFNLPSSVWHRLRMLAEKAHAAVAIFTPFKMVGCATVRWSLVSSFELHHLHQKRDYLDGLLQVTQLRGQPQAEQSGNSNLSLQS